MTSRERLLSAINLEKSDYVPCSHMLFDSLRRNSKNDLEFAEKQLEMGVDPVFKIDRFEGNLLKIIYFNISKIFYDLGVLI